MVKIKIEPDKLKIALSAHTNAVVSFVSKKNQVYRRKLFDKINNIMEYQKTFDEADVENDYAWLEKFISADIETIKNIVELKEKTGSKEKLEFDEFEKIYTNYFSNGANKFVDAASKYNAYAFAENIDLNVCPYCDEETLSIVNKDGKRRTFDIDHFFPKSKYPAFAMCFFNLVPSGKSCNDLKLENKIGKSPYEDDIEDCTWLAVDSPNITEIYNALPEDCKIVFRPQSGMQKNIQVFGLEDRYKNHKEYALGLLRKKHDFPEEKITEMVNAGFFDSIDSANKILFESEPVILGKLRYDLLFRKS